MKIEVIDKSLNTQTKTININKFKLIDKKGQMNKYGKPIPNIVVLESDQKESFYGFENVWKNQGISLSSLNEGDKLEITFKVNGNYKNFVSVKKVQIDNRDLSDQELNEFFK